MANMHMKMCSRSLVIRERQIKIIMRYYYIPIWIDLKKNKTLTLPVPDVDAEKLESSYITGGNANCYKLFESCLEVSNKIKYTLTIWPSNSTPGYLSTWNKNLCSNKNLHMNIYSIFIQNC